MLLPQATTIASLLLKVPGIDCVTIERGFWYSSGVHDANQSTEFRLRISDKELDAEALARILEYDGAEKLWPGGTQGRLAVTYSESAFLIEDAPETKKAEKT